jgi:phytoene dehydrogenase-like protein
MGQKPDAIVVGSGPNGLAAAITLARAGLSVFVLEANATIGGGARSAELTLPGFIHDTCSSIHPLALMSPFFRQLPLEQFGLEWIQPPIPIAHPLAASAAVLKPSVESTAEHLGPDGASYQKLMLTLVTHWKELADDILQPPLHWPQHPFAVARFGLRSLRPASTLARQRFKTEAAQALFAGLASHSFLRLNQLPSSAFGLLLGMSAHAVGWPMPRGGAQKITGALAAYLKSLGGTIETNHRVKDLDSLPPARAVLLDITPRQFLKIAGDRLPARYRDALQRYRYGPAAFKVDYALAAPIPWRSAECAQAGTVHLGGTLSEIETAEQMVAHGQIPERPFVLLAQHSLFDLSRAPTGKHSAWAYCHVPHACTADVAEKLEAQIERFAPGFREIVLARHVTTPQMLEAGNANLVGGDINGGLASLRQQIARPVLSPNPYRTPLKGVYLCSASTPPGGGVHGMCGYHAARLALRRDF